MTAITERYLQDQVRQLCGDLGLAVQHLEDSRRSWLPGWPDLVILGYGKIYHWELKSQHGIVTPEQRQVGHRIIAAGGTWGVRKPDDLLSGRITAELTAISRIGTR